MSLSQENRDPKQNERIDLSQLDFDLSPFLSIPCFQNEREKKLVRVQMEGNKSRALRIIHFQDFFFTENERERESECETERERER